MATITKGKTFTNGETVTPSTLHQLVDSATISGIVNADISATAAIVDTKLATISTAGKVSNSATTATNANTASAIVSRDASGNFTAGTITATLSGNATNVTGTVAVANGGTGATTAANARTNLGLGNSATLNTGTTSGTVATGDHTHSAATTSAAGFLSATDKTKLDAATNANTASAIVARDASGNFSAGTITATLSGNATNVTGTVAVANGGTGATTAANARTNLGLGNSATLNTGTTASTVATGDHTHDAAAIASGTLAIARIPTGTTSTTVALGNDSRLSDARTPTSHTHGNITNAGAIGTTANLPVVTTTSGVLTTIPAGSAGQVLTSNGGTSAPSFQTLAATSTNANNLTGGSAGTVPYQSAAGTTAMLAAGTSGQVLRSNGAAAPSWLTLAASATTDTTNAANISSGTLPLARIPTGTTASTVCIGNDSRLSDARTPTSHTHDAAAITSGTLSNARTTATNANTASAIVARDASGNFSAGTITATLSGNATNVTGTVAVANGGTGATTAAAARTNLGLGNSATLNTGTAAGTVATGDHTHDAAAITSGTLPNSRTTATSSKSPTAIVARDIAGDFSAGRVTASLTIPKGGSIIFQDTFGTDYELRGNSTDDKLFLRSGGLDILEIDSTTGAPVWKFKQWGSSKIGLFKDNPSTALDVNGTVTATDFAGNLNSGSITSKASVSGGHVFRIFEAIASGSVYGAIELDRDSAAGSVIPYIQFYQLGANRGNITPSGASGVAYNTASDYRLKTNLEPLTDAVARLLQIPVHRFNWLADPAAPKVDGFLAHEAQAVVPESVTGHKDEVDAEGKPIHQGIDQSKLVPLLVAAVQELAARVATLEAAQ